MRLFNTKMSPSFYLLTMKPESGFRNIMLLWHGSGSVRYGHSQDNHPVISYAMYLLY